MAKNRESEAPEIAGVDEQIPEEVAPFIEPLIEMFLEYANDQEKLTEMISINQALTLETATFNSPLAPNMSFASWLRLDC